MFWDLFYVILFYFIFCRFPPTDWPYWRLSSTSVGLLSSDQILDRLQALVKVSRHTPPVWRRTLLRFAVFKWEEDLVCPDLSSTVTSTWVNAWSDWYRRFIWSLSCEWGCTIPSTHDRGAQAPSLCPRRAKNWSVWWVSLGVLHLQADATSPLVLFR